MDERRLLDALIGLYVALLVVPAGALLGWWPARTGSLREVVAGTSVVVAVLAALVCPPDLDDRLLTPPVAALTIVPPLAYVPRILASASGTPESALAYAGVSALVPGIVLPFAGAIVRKRRLRAAATEIAVVIVDDDTPDWVRGAAVFAIGCSLLSLMLSLFGGDLSPQSLGTSLTMVATALAMVANGNDVVTVTDLGIETDQAFFRWDGLDGYRVTDQSVELVRPEWYLSSIEFDRTEISDEDAFVEGIGQFLPRLDDHGRVETAIGRQYRA